MATARLLDCKSQIIGRCPGDIDSVAVAFLVYPEVIVITATNTYTRGTKEIKSRISEFQQMIDRGETEEVSEIAQHIYMN